MIARTPDTETRQLAWLWFAAVLSALALKPLWFALAPLFPACPFRSLTGVPCPSCGTTRAALAVLEGHPARALGLNPLATAAGVAFAVGGLLAPVWVALRWPIPALPRPLPLWVRVALVATLAANWVWVILEQG